MCPGCDSCASPDSCFSFGRGFDSSFFLGSGFFSCPCFGSFASRGSGSSSFRGCDFVFFPRFGFFSSPCSDFSYPCCGSSASRGSCSVSFRDSRFFSSRDYGSALSSPGFGSFSSLGSCFSSFPCSDFSFCRYPGFSSLDFWFLLSLCCGFPEMHFCFSPSRHVSSRGLDYCCSKKSPSSSGPSR